MSRAVSSRFAAILAVFMLAPQVFGQAKRVNPELYEDETPLVLGTPTPVDDNRSIYRSMNDREPIYDPNVRPTQYQPNLQLNDDFQGVGRGELNIAPPAYERYSALSAADRPFRFDYIFFGRAGVHAPPGGSVMMHELNFSYRMRIPFFDQASLRVQPFFNVLFLNGPTGHDPVLPPQVYKLAADVELGYRLSEAVLLSFALTPGIWSDFRGIDGADFRIPTRVLAAYKVNDGLYFSAGLIYTDNFYRNLLPTVGVIWEATDRWRFELVAPRGKVIYKLHEEIQFYGGIEGGGDTYTIRTDGVPEDFQYRDYRFFFGTEIGTWERASLFLETGLSFNRRFRMDNQLARNLDNSFVMRVGARF